MCFVRYIENHPRNIVESFKHYVSKYPEPCILLKDIISTGIQDTDKAMKLLRYIAVRKDKFTQS